MRAGEYKLEDLLLRSSKDRNLGEYKNHKVILKTGKFGPYLAWNSKNKSIGDDIDLETVTLDDVTSYLDEINETSTIIRIIDENTSIRVGKFGDYVFHKTTKAKNPVFIKLNEFIKLNGNDSYKTCDIKDLVNWLSKDKRFTRA